MYAIGIIRYRCVTEEVLKHTEAHRAYLKSLHEQGVLLVSGPCVPRHGGALLVRVPDDGHLATLDRLREGDPYIKAGVVQYEWLPWNPGIGLESLEKL